MRHAKEPYKDKGRHQERWLATQFTTALARHPIYYRVAKMHRTPYLYRCPSAKETYNSWLFSAKRPATLGILCILATLYRI